MITSMGKTLVFSILSILFLMVLQCCSNNSSTKLPKDIFGISVAMDKSVAEQKLKDIAKLIRVERKGQEVWAIKNDPSFGYLALGYNKENQIKFITAFAKPVDGIPITPEEIGSLSNAKHETAGPNYTYTWDVLSEEEKPAYRVMVQGSQPEKISFYSLSAINDQNSEEEEEEERGEK